ncbi:MAG: amidohydrolase family protein [Bacteroidota bacterium]
MRIFVLLFSLLVSTTLWSQDYFPTNTGVKSTAETPIVFTNATIQIDSKNQLENGKMLIKDGKIIAVGENINIPEAAVEINLNGKYIYPSFIDLYSDFGIKKVKATKNGNKYKPNRKGYYWNDHIRADQNAADAFSFDEKKAKKYREAGFGSVNTHVPDGVIRGNGILVGLNDSDNSNQTILANNSAQYFAFERSKQTQQAYPSSIMGYTALLRQTYQDAEWYKKGNIKQKDLALEAFLANQSLPQIFHAGDYLNILRAAKIGHQFDVDYIFYGGGDEYKRLDAIKALNAKLILPLNFPDAYDVEDPFMAQYISLEEMKHWQHAPKNPMWLAEAGIDFAFTTHQLKEPKELFEKVAIAIKNGLPKEKALRALTETPAEILALQNQIGKLEKGMVANFIITSGEIFEKETSIYENWVLGNRNILKDLDQTPVAGTYKLNYLDEEIDLSISEKNSKYSIEAKKDRLKLGSKIKFEKNWLTFSLTETDSAAQKINRFSAHLPSQTDTITGKVSLHNGDKITFKAIKTTAEEEDNSEEEEEEENQSKEKNSKDNSYESPITYPNMAFGRSENISSPSKIIIKNATVITGEEEGTLTETDVYIKDGKIKRIGKNISIKGAEEIDGTDKYLTAGIIDEHSHIAATSVNEGGQNSSAETTMEDAVNPDDISIYRALAGGVTSIQLLHGSANPIGGRSAILKLKWGADAEEMIYDNSPKFIKFALGENVKQSNWGSGRFPQTRMGVEQVFVDYFSRAKAYGEKKSSGKDYRKDDEMETLLEIIEGERFISCHSYVQSEINMLMKVAEKFDFKVNTFTHILEGYKVADKMKEHGAGGSTFSDWWAYKNEVKDAIPQNAAIMHKAGITVAINSDDGEMIRRLNQEAAKSMKYADIEKEEAWKFVTLNPAKLLHLENRVGSIKKGKDADLVLWSHHPLSMYAKAEKTMIEGVIYFDIEKDLELQEHVKEERSKLIQEMLRAKNSGMKTQPITKKEKQFLHCNSLNGQLENHHNH